jgi:hypothetical protein
MLNVNLVPQNIKDELKFKTISNSINSIIAILLIFIGLAVAACYGAIFYLEKQFDIKADISKNIDKDTEVYTNELIAINKITDYTAKIQTDYIKWSNLFYSIGLLTNNEIYFNSLTIDKKNNSLVISAHAKTRDGLLSFKDKIEKSPYLSDIAFPLKTLFEKENIDFTINATISSYEFNKL